MPVLSYHIHFNSFYFYEITLSFYGWVVVRFFFFFFVWFFFFSSLFLLPCDYESAQFWVTSHKCQEHIGKFIASPSSPSLYSLGHTCSITWPTGIVFRRRTQVTNTHSTPHKGWRAFSRHFTITIISDAWLNFSHDLFDLDTHSQICHFKCVKIQISFHTNATYYIFIVNINFFWSDVCFLLSVH